MRLSHRIPIGALVWKNRDKKQDEPHARGGKDQRAWLWPSHVGIIVTTLLAIAPQSSIVAQEPEPTRVVSDGVGTVYTAPSHVSFWLQFPLPEGDLSRGLPAATPIEGQIRKFFALRDLRPVATDIHSPHIDSLAESRSHVAIELRFSMAGLMGGETAVARFGALCEDMKTLGKQLPCLVSDPELVLEKNGVVIQEAVQEAAARALTAAAGAAAAMGQEIHTAERIEVLSVTWNKPPDTKATFPNINVIACTAQVRVTYALH